ncbi:hypothetical protein FVE85_6242 [Porphyridium purpureum]|uniref:Uncharacterized protein n=1 Tax=Porphyridium purpureum TaxID=35688 RepID=A0A5J4Z7L2_PORPP|nr:hypothetical protein FVE85_6242 [Porphyridium purpureum]|eukprot:POR3719..scf295_1
MWDFAGLFGDEKRRALDATESQRMLSANKGLFQSQDAKAVGNQQGLRPARGMRRSFFNRSQRKTGTAVRMNSLSSPRLQQYDRTSSLGHVVCLERCLSVEEHRSSLLQLKQSGLI